MSALAARIVSASSLQRGIIAVILLAGILSGLETSAALVERHRALLGLLDALVLGVFGVEAGLKVAARGRRGGDTNAVAHRFTAAASARSAASLCGRANHRGGGRVKRFFIALIGGSVASLGGNGAGTRDHSTAKPMQLVQNLHHLRPEFFGRSRELLSRLSSGENSPPALLITCADAALLAECLMPDNPERFFCVSALGAFVPAVSTSNGDGCDSTTAAIDYAVRVLRVGDIIVCGHTGCRAMTLLRGAPAGMRSPHLSAWRGRIKPILDVLRSRYAHVTSASERQRVAEVECVLFSLENLQTHPCVRERLESGALRLHGWFYVTATEKLSAYEPASGQFEPLMGVRSLAGRPAGDFRMDPR